MLTAVYQVLGSPAEARAAAERICFDQTIEADASLLDDALRDHVLGRLQDLRPLSPGRYEATIAYPDDLVGRSCADLLNLLFGTSSLRTGVRVTSFHLAPHLAARWLGPRFGMEGLRQACRVPHRPLVCAVLKPLGRSPADLARLASEFVQGGVDVIKDDQGLADQPFCRFEERVSRCADSIAKGALQRGRPCLYLPHVSGSAPVIRRRAELAKQAGAGGLLIAPGLTGFDALHDLATDDTIGLPIASHPAFLGTYAADPDAGVSPGVLYGLLPRLAGADISIYPGFAAGYGMSADDCLAVATSCTRDWDQRLPTMPTAAGRIGIEQVRDYTDLYGTDVLFILGSRIQRHGPNLAHATDQFMRAVDEAGGTPV